MEARRLFFGLAPPAPTRAALARVAQALRAQAGSAARASADAQLHLTLAFLGECRGEEALARARSAGERTPGRRFALVIDQAASFGSTWFLAPAVAPPELLALQAGLGRELAHAGFTLEQRAYRPHLTILRRAARPLPRIEVAPIAWPVADFVLFESRPVERSYRELGRWPLAEAGMTSGP